LHMEAAFYHQGPHGIETGCFLGQAAGPAFELNAEERANKQKLLDCFPSQRETLAYFPPQVERFRMAPAYDFSEPPHPGTLFYEHYPWGITGERFRQLAAEVLLCR
jgi:N-acetylglucosamine malate deacetylase 2